MKSTGSTHGRTPITAWQHEPKAKDAIVLRIQKITRELEVMQAEIHDQLTETSTQKSRFFEDHEAVEALNHFKAELDQFRRILWFYIEQAAGAPIRGMDHEQQSHQLQRVTEVLRALSPQTSTPAVPTEEGSGSFFERLNLVIDTYMQEKKQVTAETRSSQPINTKAFS